MNIKILIIGLLISSGLANAAEERTVAFSGTIADKYKNEEQPVQVFTCDNYQQTPTFSLCWDGSTSPSCVNTTEANENINDHQFKYGQTGDIFLTKYYLASPPAPLPSANGGPVVLGLLKPDDQFVLTENAEAIAINMDYTLLQAVYLSDITIDYKKGFNCTAIQSCNIPVNTVCPIFPYDPSSGKKSGVGKGIGLMSKDDNSQGKIFLPFTDRALEKPLQCHVSILNDIIKDYTVHFVEHDGKNKPTTTDKINLTNAYIQQNTPGSDYSLSVVYTKRNPGEYGARCLPVYTE